MKQPRLVTDIPIFHKIYELYKLMHTYHRRVPKSERYTLWQNCEATALSLFKTLVETGPTIGEERLRALWRLNNQLELLKILVRLAEDTRCIDSEQYLALQTLLKEIGRMVGGWIKSVPP